MGSYPVMHDEGRTQPITRAEISSFLTNSKTIMAYYELAGCPKLMDKFNERKIQLDTLRCAFVLTEDGKEDRSAFF